jgi:Na+-transporting methylmalonyl-CoA/oxaloacetate decarboxylase gamma subunit
MPPAHEILEALELLLSGMFFVLAVLGLLYGLCAAIGAFFSRQDKSTHSLQPSAHLFSHHQHPTAEEAEVIDIPFVLAATVDRMMAGVKYRILRVREISPTQSDWSREGRRSIFTSHRTR